MSTVKQRVQRGAELLDAHWPGWTDKIDIEILDMGECDRCVLGQIFGDYNTGAELLGVEDVIEVWPWARNLGFDVHNAASRNPSNRYAELRTAWVDLIRARQANTP